MNTLLGVKSLSSGYDKLQTLWNVNLTVFNGERVVVLGANGAGKSTLLKTLVGLVPRWDGTICLDNQQIERLGVDERIRSGISYVSEIGIVAGLTIEDNLKLGGYFVPRTEVVQRIEEMYVRFPILKEKRKQLGGSLSGGQRKMLSAAKALMSNPKLLIMDEPSAGLSPLLVTELIEFLNNFHDTGLALLIAEQNVKFLDIADRVYVLDGGRLTFEGTVAELQQNDAIQQAYFGVGKH